MGEESKQALPFGGIDLILVHDCPCIGAAPRTNLFGSCKAAFQHRLQVMASLELLLDQILSRLRGHEDSRDLRAQRRAQEFPGGG